MGPDRDFSTRVALVVGGYGAIGQAVSRELAEQGSRVVIAGRNRARAQALADEIEAEGGRAAAAEINADDVPAMRRCVAEIWAHWGGVDFLVNCLGRQHEQRVLDVTEEGFDAVLRTNLKAAMFLGQALASHQAAQGHGGKHVHLLSLRATLGYRDRGYSAFTSSKGGLAALVRQHAAELAPFGITVNGVAPGIVRTHKNAALTGDPDALRRLVEPIPLGRLAEPRDVAQAVVFLCSSAASFITGQTLYLDGGMTICR